VRRDGLAESLTLHDLAAEQATIGAILCGEAFMQAAAAIVSQDDFFHLAHRAIWSAASSLRARGECVDLLTVGSALQDAGTLDATGGREYLNKLLDLRAISADHAAHYAQLVRDKAIRRSIARIANDLPGLVLDGKPLPDVLRAVSDHYYRLMAMPAREKAAVSAADIMAMDIPEMRWIVPGLVPEGASLLVGRAKMGKSWLALQMAVGVAAGGRVLGSIKVEPGPVLYLALEDSHRRIKSRLAKVLAGQPCPRDLMIATDWQRLNQGGESALDGYCRKAKPRLLIVDVMQKLRPEGDGRKSVYQVDYSDIAPYQRLANEHRCGVLILHHMNKMKDASDPADMVSGSTGLVGAADGWMLFHRVRGSENAQLQVSGRDVFESRYALDWQNETLWTLQGEAEEVARSREDAEVMEMLVAGPHSPKQVADRLQITRQAAGQRLRRMEDRGLLISNGGVYSIRYSPGSTSAAASLIETARSAGWPEMIVGGSVIGPGEDQWQFVAENWDPATFPDILETLR